jgi:hypothetical protein
MQLQLNVNDVKSHILLKFLDIFKEDNIIQDYKILNAKHTAYNDYEKEIIEDLSALSLDFQEDDVKTDKYIEISD